MLSCIGKLTTRIQSFSLFILNVALEVSFDRIHELRELAGTSGVLHISDIQFLYHDKASSIHNQSKVNQEISKIYYILMEKQLLC